MICALRSQNKAPLRMPCPCYYLVGYLSYEGSDLGRAMRKKAFEEFMSSEDPVQTEAQSDNSILSDQGLSCSRIYSTYMPIQIY